METGDIVLVSLREYEDDKADIIHKYYEGEAVQLIRAEEIPDTGRLISTSLAGTEAALLFL